MRVSGLTSPATACGSKRSRLSVEIRIASAGRSYRLQRRRAERVGRDGIDVDHDALSCQPEGVMSVPDQSHEKVPAILEHSREHDPFSGKSDQRRKAKGQRGDSMRLASEFDGVSFGL